MATIDDQLAELLGKNADLYAAYEVWANGQIMLLAGTVDDPASFNAEGGKDGALGYYPVVNVSGQTIYVPSIARLRALALGGENAETLDALLATTGAKLAAVEAATAEATTQAGNAQSEAARAKAQADAIGNIADAVTASGVEAAKAKGEADRAAAARAAAEQVAALRLIDSDDEGYVAYIVDGSEAQNILARFRRSDGAMDFVPGPALAAALAKGEAALAQIAALAATVPRLAGNAVAAALSARFADADDQTYVAYLVDGSPEQNILARWRRSDGGMDFVPGPALAAELAKGATALAQIAALSASLPALAGDAAVAALALRFVDRDDPTYVAHLVDGSPDQNVLGRWRRDTGAFEFVYDELLAQVVQDVTTGVAGSRPSGAKLKGCFRRWGRAGGVTITDNLAADPALTTRFTVDPAKPAPFTFYGGTPVVISGSLRIYRGPPNSAFGQSCGRMAFMTDAPAVQVAMNTGTLKMYRVYVDGRLESDEKQAFAAGGTNIHYPKIAFNGPRARGRRIDVEIILDGSFAVNDFTVAVPPGYKVWAVDTSQRVKIAIIGDSYTDGAGSSMNALAWPYEFGRMLGGLDVDVLAEGRGGTGYIARGPGPTDNSAATGYANPSTSGDPVRLDNIAVWGPDIVIFAYGTNDDGKPNAAADLKAAALYAYQQVRLRMPDVLIIVFGPWPAGSGPSAKKIEAEGYIRAAVDAFGDPNTFFIPVCTTTPKPWWYGSGRVADKKGDGPADWMIGDGVHLVDDGHRYVASLARRDVLPILHNYTRY